jgi:hypothetical protein
MLNFLTRSLGRYSSGALNYFGSLRCLRVKLDIIYNSLHLFSFVIRVFPFSALSLEQKTIKLCFHKVQKRW